jgi:hypothetical protein
MERLVDRQIVERFAAANLELNAFLRKVDGLANGTESITEENLKSLSQRIAVLDPLAAEILSVQEHDAMQQTEITEYVQNLRALQSALETVRCVTLARKTQLDGARRHLQGLQGWVSAYRQTT